MPRAEPTGCLQHEAEWLDNRDADNRDAAGPDTSREVAMATVMKSTTIPASVDAVWALLADFAAISQWAPNVDHSCLMSDQTEGVGMVRRIQTGRTTVVETVEHWEPGVALRYAITGLPPIIRSVTNAWSIEPDGDATTATLTTEIDAGPRPPQQGIAKAVGRKLGQASDEMLAGLATHFATSPGQPGQLQEQHA
jgi:uncharacterized protein YndB with AHSA1/START domain